MWLFVWFSFGRGQAANKPVWSEQQLRNKMPVLNVHTRFPPHPTPPIHPTPHLLEHPATHRPRSCSTCPHIPGTHLCSACTQTSTPHVPPTPTQRRTINIHPPAPSLAQELRDLPDSSVLPADYPALMICALCPPLFFRVMDPLLDGFYAREAARELKED